MGWLNRTPRLHECVKPSPYEGEAGSTWQCDDCKRRWVITVDVSGGRRRGDHHWVEQVNPTDLPTAPAGPSGTPSPDAWKGAGDPDIQEDIKARAIAELTQAIAHTAEYVGQDMLPPLEGWSWYDALLRYAPTVAAEHRARYDRRPL